MSDHADLDGLIAPFVLGAAAEDEMDQVRSHLDGCIECRHAVDRLQGVIEALPLAAEPLQPPTRLRARILAAAAASRCRVAVCDDVTSFRELLRIVFRSHQGYEVVGEAANGREAVELARHTQPDVMLLDVAMPVMDGLEALPRITEVAPGTRVIVLTGFGSDSMRSRAFEAGAAGYIEKGASPSVMIDAVQAAYKA